MENEKQSVSSQQKCDWNSIDWSHVVAFVRRLRQEIFLAAKEGNSCVLSVVKASTTARSYMNTM